MSGLASWIRGEKPDLLRLAPYYFCVSLIVPKGSNTPISGDVIGFRVGGKRRTFKVLEVMTTRDDSGRLFVRAEGYHPIDIVAVDRVPERPHV